jgi:hypothetical protein
MLNEFVLLTILVNKQIGERYNTSVAPLIKKENNEIDIS